jgi:hypothetical protein
MNRVLPTPASIPIPDPAHLPIFLLIGTAMRPSFRHAMFTAFFAALLGGAMAACAPLPASEGGAKPGLKHGWVSGFYTVRTPRGELPACLAALPPERFEGHLFVKIDYRAVRRMMVEVAEVPTGVVADGQALKLGDRVELWPEDCLRGRLSRITRLMPLSAPSAPFAS